MAKFILSWLLHKLQWHNWENTCKWRAMSYEPAYRNLLLSCKVGTKGRKCHIIPFNSVCSQLHPCQMPARCTGTWTTKTPSCSWWSRIPHGVTTLAADFHKHFVCLWTQRFQCCFLPRSEAPVSLVTGAFIFPLKQTADLSNFAVFGERVWQMVSLNLNTKYSRKLSGVLKTQVES